MCVWRASKKRWILLCPERLQRPKAPTAPSSASTHSHLPAKYIVELRHSTQRLIRSSYFQVCNIAEASFRRLDAAEYAAMCESWLASRQVIEIQSLKNVASSPQSKDKGLSRKPLGTLHQLMNSMRPCESSGRFGPGGSFPRLKLHPPYGV